MYLRTTTRKHKDRTYRYVHLVESVWDNGRSRQKIVLSLGRADQLDPKRLRQIQALLGKLVGDDPVERLKGVAVGASRYLLARVMELRLAEAGITWADQIGRPRQTYPMTAGRALDLLDEVKAVEIHLDGHCLDHISRIGPAVRSILEALDALPAQRTLPRDV